MADLLLLPAGLPRALVLIVAAGILAAIWLRRRWLPDDTPVGAAPAPAGTTRCLVVVARNEERTLPALLGDLGHLLGEDEGLSILLADDASTDGTRSLFEAFCARHPPERARLLPARPDLRGKPAWLQAAVSACRAGQLLFSDADCRLPPGWSLALGGRLAQGLAAAGGPVLLERNPPANLAARWQRLHWVLLSGLGAALSVRRGSAPSLWGANLAFDRAAVEALGGYAELARASVGEDLALCRALVTRGARVRLFGDPGLCVRTAAGGWSDCARQMARWSGGLPRLAGRDALLVLAAALWLASLAGILLVKPLLGLLLGAAAALALAALLGELAGGLDEEPVTLAAAALYLAAWPPLALGALWLALRGDTNWRRPL